MENMPIDNSANSPERLSPADQPGKQRIDREKLKKVCADFEALFLARLLKAMRQSGPQSGFFGNDPGREIYQSLMDQELSQKLSQREGLGLGMMIYRQVLKREEKTPPVSPGGQRLEPLARPPAGDGGG